MEKRKYDSTIARMAGNMAAFIVSRYVTIGCELRDEDAEHLARLTVKAARAIVRETERTDAALSVDAVGQRAESPI